MKKLAVALVLALFAIAGCSSAPPAPTAQPLVVFAAASLKAAFTEIAALDPGLQARFSFEGSSTLVDQLAGGAKADVFASADEKNMTSAVTKGLISGEPATFATNHLVLVVPKGNPGKVTGLDSSLKGKKLVICAVGVPCGNATKELAKRLSVTLTPVSEEQKVTDVLGKVSSGEADAGIVYVTDAKGSTDKTETIAIPGADKVINHYKIGSVAHAANPQAAQRFIQLVMSPEGQAILAKYGFGHAPS